MAVMACSSQGVQANEGMQELCAAALCNDPQYTLLRWLMWG